MALWVEEELPTPPWAKSLLLHLIWDVIDLTAFVWWFASYTPHIVETDKADFTAICMITMVIGAILVVGGVAMASCTKIEAPCYGKEYDAMTKKLDAINADSDKLSHLQDAFKADPNVVTVEEIMRQTEDIDRRFSDVQKELEYEPGKDFYTKWIEPDRKHPFFDLVRIYACAEVVYDMWQLFVLWWLVEAKHAGMTEDRWEGKIIVDLVNVLTTFIDVFLWKGPSVINTVWHKFSNS